MADSASKPSWKAWKIVTVSVVLVVAYVVARNCIYIRGGLLSPDFELIHKAFDFNFYELPLTLLVASGVLSILAIFWQLKRRVLILLAIFWAFIGVDLFALRYYMTVVEPSHLAVRFIRLETPKLTQTVRLLHISDIQSGGITDYEVELFETIKELEPDIIVNTGDFLQVVPPKTFNSELPKLLKLIREVNPRLGTYGVFGDTEYELYRVRPEVLAPLKMLSSRTERIDTGYGVLSLHGLSLYQSRNESWALRTVDHWLRLSEAQEFKILFGHAPDFAMEVGDRPVDLCLAGHTHGGQVRLPWYGPLVIDSKIPKEWSRGFHRIGLPFLNVSAGAGSNRYKGLPKIRFNCPTEMTLIELVPIRAVQ